MAIWKNEKTRLLASWAVNTPAIFAFAQTFAIENPNAPIVYRSRIKHEELQTVITPDTISILWS
jgi:hypothetical protein